MTICPLCGKEMIPEWDANDDMGTWLECPKDHLRVKQEQTDFSHEVHNVDGVQGSDEKTDPQ